MEEQIDMELLAPAGGMEQLRAAVRFGADAVYLAADRFGMRARAANFRLDEISAAVAFAHDHGVKVHVACNILMHPDDIDELPAFFRAMDAAGVDAFIIGDLGAFAVAGEVAPRVERHVSTQASVANAAAARVWHSLGASRVVCAREMSLADIARLRQDAPPDLEIEAFAHGAMCMAVSGRCLISSYLTGRSGNKGHCTQPCRWSYQLGTAVSEKFAPPEAPTEFLLEEEKRPGEFFPIEEDDRGTFIMNAKDMNMLAHLRELARVGVDSIKIEGRNKKAFYVASVVGAYRRVLDGEPPAAVADELLAVSHRPYGTGFYFSEAEQAPAYDGYEQETMHVADVAACRDGFLYVLCRNRFAEGDELEILAPHEPSRPLIVRDLHWLSIFGPDNHDEDAPATAGEALARATAADWEAAAVANRSCNLYRIRLAAASDGAASGTSDTSSASDMRDASNVSVASDMRDASNVSVMSDTCGASGGSAPCAPSLSAHVSEGSFLRKRTFRRSARHG
ncbi:MAG TPA: U32 family peptidase [Adlercreutzia equolifaciens]|uniref:peptidase U32 family protein n=1 Tax=Adlercreutzia equolifaciens TaxID=446660 RepID=UPI00242AA353|nr:peptidase U32 family protein [Adlercreutzia equolifaciens]HJI12589.1 U32 family peptidase [Adlercreutzia equolifaciens]